MTTFMNDYDRQFAIQRFIRASKPNRLALAIMVDRLAEWADFNSDGWAYWAPPRNAAKRAVEHIASTTNRANDEQEREDITEEEMLAAVRPVKAFLTRMQVTGDRREIILRSTRPMFEVI